MAVEKSEKRRPSVTSTSKDKKDDTKTTEAAKRKSSTTDSSGRTKFSVDFYQLIQPALIRKSESKRKTAKPVKPASNCRERLAQLHLQQKLLKMLRKLRKLEVILCTIKYIEICSFLS